MISFNDISIGSLIPLLISMFIAQTSQIIFEEFSWRGYLAAELFNLRISRYLSHFIVGIGHYMAYPLQSPIYRYIS